MNLLPSFTRLRYNLEFSCLFVFHKSVVKRNAFHYKVAITKHNTWTVWKKILWKDSGDWWTKNPDRRKELIRDKKKENNSKNSSSQLEGIKKRMEKIRITLLGKLLDALIAPLFRQVFNFVQFFPEYILRWWWKHRRNSNLYLFTHPRCGNSFLCGFFFALLFCSMLLK